MTGVYLVLPRSAFVGVTLETAAAPPVAVTYTPKSSLFVVPSASLDEAVASFGTAGPAALMSVKVAFDTSVLPLAAVETVPLTVYSPPRVVGTPVVVPYTSTPLYCPPAGSATYTSLPAPEMATTTTSLKVTVDFAARLAWRMAATVPVNADPPPVVPPVVAPVVPPVVAPVEPVEPLPLEEPAVEFTWPAPLELPLEVTPAPPEVPLELPEPAFAPEPLDEPEDVPVLWGLTDAVFGVVASRPQATAKARTTKGLTFLNICIPPRRL